jgi:hypothetical protein
MGLNTVSSACAEAIYLYNRSKSIFTYTLASNVGQPQNEQPLGCLNPSNRSSKIHLGLSDV